MSRRVVIFVGLGLLLVAASIAIGVDATNVYTPTLVTLGVELTCWSQTLLSYIVAIGAILMLAEAIIGHVGRDVEDLREWSAVIVRTGGLLIMALMSFVCAGSNSRAELEVASSLFSILGCMFLAAVIPVIWRFRRWLRSRHEQNGHPTPA